MSNAFRLPPRIFIRHGLNQASRINEPIPRRRAVTPCGPTTGNKVFAKDAPPCSESMAISNSNTATSGEALLANMGTETESAGALLCAGFSTLLIGELPLGEFLSDSVIL